MSIKEIPQDDNSRTEPRLPHNEIIYVEFLTPGAFESDNIGPAIRSSQTIDISANGIQVRVVEPLRVNAIMQICIVREKTGERYVLAAEVRWQRRLPGSSGYLTGLSFFESDDTSIAQWKLAVSAMLSDDYAEHVFC